MWNYIYGAATPWKFKMVLSVIDDVTIFREILNCKRASKLHYWFWNYHNFSERVDFAYWWSMSSVRSAINGATPFSHSQSLHKRNHFKVLTHYSIIFVFFIILLLSGIQPCIWVWADLQSFPNKGLGSGAIHTSAV